MKSWRINFIIIIFFLMAATIISRLIYYQIINHKYWQALAQGQQKFFVEFQGERGGIFFKDNTDLAVNHEFPLVYAVTNEIKNYEETAQDLNLILGLDKDLILEKLEKDSLYVLLKKKLNEDELNNIKNLNLPGIYLGKENGRYYPFGNLASHLTGFLGGNNQGQYGLEGYYDEYLRGKEDAKELEKGPAGYVTNLDEDSSVDIASKGSDIVLTLDYNIQFMAEKLLAESEKDLEFESAEIVVSEPKSGKIIALANWPNFDPNKYSEIEDFNDFRDSSIQKVFEPGSIFKPFTIAAALDQNRITPQTKFIDEGYVRIGNDVISNFDNKNWGQRTMTEVLQWSINTGAVFAEQQIDHQTFLDYIKNFGFFEKTGIDLQGEDYSKNEELKKGYEINFATAAFGQGIDVTSIQLVRAFAAIANGGKLLKPYIVEKIIHNGKTTQIQPQIQNLSVISQKTASQLSLMLVNVVDSGYGKLAGVPGYYIAGKTGTAQIPWSSLGINKRGYSDETIQSFIGFAPALDPQFLILVKLYNPKTTSAEASAAPIFGQLAKYIIDLWHIPPDRE